MPTRRKTLLPVLGARITVRKKDGVYRFAFTAVTLAAVSVILMLFLVLAPLPWWWANLLMSVPVVLGMLTYALRAVYQVVEFYEHAAVQRVFSRVRVFPYHEVTDVGFEAIRQLVNQVHVATIFKMRLTMSDGRKLRIEGKYEGDDDRIHIVRERIRASAAGDGAGVSDETGPSKKRYYVWSVYQEKGPYSIKQLREALNEETFTESTPVRAEDEIDSQPLRALLRQRPGNKSRR